MGEETFELGNRLTNNYLQWRIQAIKDKRAAKEEKARYEKLAETMQKSRVERLKRKEKRNYYQMVVDSRKYDTICSESRQANNDLSAATAKI